MGLFSRNRVYPPPKSTQGESSPCRLNFNRTCGVRKMYAYWPIRLGGGLLIFTSSGDARKSAPAERATRSPPKNLRSYSAPRARLELQGCRAYITCCKAPPRRDGCPDNQADFIFPLGECPGRGKPQQCNHKHKRSCPKHFCLHVYSLLARSKARRTCALKIRFRSIQKVS